MVAGRGRPILCCRAMRTDSHRLAATLVALGFVAGWFSGSWVSPPTAMTQERPRAPRRAAARRADAAHRPPRGDRARHDAGVRPQPLRVHGSSVRGAAGLCATVRRRCDRDARGCPGVSPRSGSGRIHAADGRGFGIAADSAGRITAVVSGGGDVFLLGLGDRLPDGSSVVELDAAGLVVSTPSGERLTLRPAVRASRAITRRPASLGRRPVGGCERVGGMRPLPRSPRYNVALVRRGVRMHGMVGGTGAHHTWCKVVFCSTSRGIPAGLHGVFHKLFHRRC